MPAEATLPSADIPWLWGYGAVDAGSGEGLLEV
jgi:hypothetical protein